MKDYNQIWINYASFYFIENRTTKVSSVKRITNLADFLRGSLRNHHQNTRVSVADHFLILQESIPFDSQWKVSRKFKFSALFDHTLRNCGFFTKSLKQPVHNKTWNFYFFVFWFSHHQETMNFNNILDQSLEQMKLYKILSSRHNHRYNTRNYIFSHWFFFPGDTEDRLYLDREGVKSIFTVDLSTRTYTHPRPHQS
jgi:hypothetical protein